MTIVNNKKLHMLSTIRPKLSRGNDYIPTCHKIYPASSPKHGTIVIYSQILIRFAVYYAPYADFKPTYLDTKVNIEMPLQTLIKKGCYAYTNYDHPIYITLVNGFNTPANQKLLDDYIRWLDIEHDYEYGGCTASTSSEDDVAPVPEIIGYIRLTNGKRHPLYAD